MGTIAHKIAGVSSNLELATRAGDFNQLARLIVQHNGELRDVRPIVHQIKGLSPRVVTIVKSAVDPGGTTEGNWAAPLGDLCGGFCGVAGIAAGGRCL